MDSLHRKLISIVIPAWNESEVLDELFSRLIQLMERQSSYGFEVILIDNGSWDDSWDKMLQIRAKDGRFKLVQLTRNFMADGALMAGFQVASGNAAIMMDADLQDPPELIDRFLFIFFAEDRGLFPPNSTLQILKKWQADVDFGDERPLYNLFKQYFLNRHL